MYQKFTIIAILIALSACNQNPINPQVTEIYLAEGDNNIKEFKLSEVVDDVEYIKLETRSDCFVIRPRYDVSENYILISHQYQPSQVMLFRRDGTLKTLIGKKGKGPAEYVRNSPHARISNNEKWIIVHDGGSERLLKYDINGNFKKSYSCKGSKSERLSKFEITTTNNIILFFYRPVEAVNNYPLIHVIDSDFNLIEQSFHISKDESNGGQSAGVPEIFQHKGQEFIREPFFDTLYLKNGSQYEAKFHFNYKDNMSPGYHSPFDKEYNSFIWLNLIGKYFICQTVDIDDDDRISTYYYNIETKETIHPKTNNSFNDIDGIGEVWIPTGNLEGYIADHLQIIDLKEILENKDFNTEILFPEKQKQLIKLIEESDVEDNAIIRLFHIKSYDLN